jgi:hypothetical protein
MQRQHKHTSITIEELLGYVFSMCFVCDPSRAYIEQILKEIRQGSYLVCVCVCVW